ncbi:MAG: TonB-dependent receptor [Flavobacteriaceae bacterium]
MNRRKSIVFLVVLLATLPSIAQEVGITVLDEVILSDVRLLHFSNGKKVDVLTDSIIKRDGTSLTNLLQFNSNIYFKENGLGMVSSPSFRGTTASQTAVLWNGININSQLTGQIDFNTIIPRNYGSISIRSGGGSVQFGSGAIGGSIHLDNVFEFTEHFENELMLGFGSFDTKSIQYSMSLGSEKTALNLGVNYVTSANDYTYLGTDKKNENGAFSTFGLNASLAQYLSDHQLLKFYHTVFLGDRDFSGTLTSASNSKYQDVNSRNLVEWSSFEENRISRLKLAYLYEKYKYFANKESTDFSFGHTNTAILNYDYKKQWKNLMLNGIADYTSITAKGSSIGSATRNTLAVTLLMKHELSHRFTYGADIRREFGADYKSPLVFSLNGKYRASKSYKVYASASKNYRIPTFNDMYWIGAGARGNKDLRPESSLQAEIGHVLEGEKYRLQLTGYYIASEDLIQWRPNNNGEWQPVNVAEATNYGLEISLKLSQQWREHKLSWRSGYGYTKAMNTETDKLLMYVPKHKITSNLAYTYKQWQLFYQVFYNGSVFITSDNSEALPSYAVSNIGASRNFKTKGTLNIDAAVQLNNLFNENYQNVAYRPMPNRNIQVKLTVKF